jgi:Cu-Zn family superoxide dismutase
MAELYSPRVSLKGAGGRPSLLDADGSAIVVHANPDDHNSQPIGGAGARVACGVVK